MKKEVLTQKELKSSLSRLMRDEKRTIRDVIKELQLNQKQSSCSLPKDENNPL